MKRIGIKVASYLVGLLVLTLGLTCRQCCHDDPRPELKRQGLIQVFGTLHCMQLACSMAADRGAGTMVSKSADGEILIPGLKLGGIVPIRGSSGRHSKGGASALHQLIRHARDGNSIILAVDGPRGPRGQVQKGIGLLAKKADAVIVIAIGIPRRRWILSQTWDRTQIPKPFSPIDIYFAEPIWPQPDESLNDLAARVEQALQGLEQVHDPGEAKHLVNRAEQAKSSRRRRAA